MRFEGLFGGGVGGGGLNSMLRYLQFGRVLKSVVSHYIVVYIYELVPSVIFLDICPAVIESLQLDVVPYLVLLVVPVLGRMSDQDSAVRLMASTCFGSLIRIMPLEVKYLYPHSRKDTNVPMGSDKW